MINKWLMMWVLVITLASCTESQKQQSMEINVKELGTEGLEGNLQKGVSAAYAAVLNGELLVAGGCNFPDKLGFEGGKKVFYDEIVHFDTAANTWKTVGKLQQAAAYGV